MADMNCFTALLTSLEETEMDFYKFVPDTLSTFSKDEADKYKRQGYKYLGCIKVRVRPA